MGPYAWRKAMQPASACQEHGEGLLATARDASDALTLGRTSSHPNAPLWADCLPKDLLAQTSLRCMIRSAESMGCINFRLPTAHAVAGKVLNHACDVVDTLIERHQPCIFKVGFTHDVVWRWCNNLYGYAFDRDKWSNMTVMYISSEPFSVAMLEAALISKYKCV